MDLDVVEFVLQDVQGLFVVEQVQAAPAVDLEEADGHCEFLLDQLEQLVDD